MGKRTYTDEEKSFLIDYIPGHTYQEAIDEFERLFGRRLTKQIVNGCCNHWGLRTGTLGYFPKGGKPANMIKKGTRLSPATEFKPGHVPPTYRPVGSERRERTPYGFRVKVKVADPGVWMLKQRYVWEQHHGRIPPGHVIMFRDGNKENFDIDNLACVSTSEQLAIRWLGVEWHDPETFETLLTMARVNLQCGTRMKKGGS